MSFAKGRRVLITLSAFAISASAQETKLELTGKVTEAATGIGIAGAQVNLRHSGTTEERKLVCDHDGKFHTTIEPPGRWMAKAQAEGYIVPSIFLDFVAVDVLPGATSKREVGLSLIRAAQISGRLIDHHSKEPLAGFPVTLLEAIYFKGRQTLVQYGSVLSQPDGRFELHKVPSGEVILEIRQPGREQFVKGGQPDYTEKTPQPIGYPRSQWPEAATNGEFHGSWIAPGSSLDFGKIELDRHPLLRVRAEIHTQTCEPGQTVNVSFTQRYGHFFSSRTHSTVPCNTVVSLTGLAPGNYVISAWSADRPASEREFAELELTLSADLDTEIDLRPPSQLQGAIRVGDDTEYVPSRLPNVKSALRSTGTVSFMEEEAKAIESDSSGVFHLPMLPRKEYELIVTGLEAPYVVTELVYNGTKLPGINFNPQPGADHHQIEVKIAPVAASLTGQVRQDDKPVQGVRLLVAPWPAVYNNGYPVFQEVESAEDGSYRAERLRPGKYHVIAVSPSARPRFERTEELLSALKSADEVELGPSAARVVNLNHLIY